MQLDHPNNSRGLKMLELSVSCYWSVLWCLCRDCTRYHQLIVSGCRRHDITII